MLHDNTIDKSYRASIHKVLMDKIPASEIKKRNKDKQWKYGYNSQYDVVIISKDGTIGEIIEIEGLAIALPSVPNKIRFEERRKDHQKWERYKVPAELQFFDKMYGGSKKEDLESKWKEVELKHRKYIEEDYKRKFEGDWFMNDGTPVYVTGYYYFFLQHYKLTDNNRYADFRMPQRDYFIFVEACFADDRCFGPLLLKGRRSSFSTSSGSICLCSSVNRKNGYYPIVSKKEADSMKLFQRHIVSPFLNLPKHFQPRRTGMDRPKSDLEFSAPQSKLSANNSGQIDSGLGTKIEYLATSVDTYDGTYVTISINDESGKYKGNIDINAYWEQHKLCHMVGSQITGKALFGSTANPPHKGGKNFEKFYNDSKISTRTKNGHTITGLYAIFIPADLSTMGFFDEYGYVIYDTPAQPIKNELGKYVTMGVKEYLDTQELSYKNDIKKYNNHKRNLPRLDTDPFLDEDATNMYATTSMVNHINFLKDYENKPKYKTQVFKFDLYYKPTADNPQNVEIKYNDNGRFMASWLPPVEFRNKFIIKNGKKFPANSHLGAIGIDPYMADRAKYGGGSKMGMVGMTTNHPIELLERDKNKTFIFYNYRPNTVEEAEDDVIKIMLFLSMPVLPETNKDSLIKRLHREKLRGYVINDPTKDKKDLSEQIKKYGGMYTSGATKIKQEEALETFISEHVDEDVDENNIKIPFNQLNIMATEYSDSTRTKLDGVVAWQLACIAVAKQNERYRDFKGNEVSEFREDEREDFQQKINILDLFKRNI